MRARVAALAATCLVAGLLTGYGLAFIEASQLRSQVASLQSELQAKTRSLSQVEGELTSLRGNYTRLLAAVNLSLALLPDRAYFPQALSLLAAANRSIHAAIYVVKYDPGDADDPVNALLEGLVAARRKGLDVRVLVDEETNASYRQTITYLQEHGVPVRLDRSSGITTHTKIVVIDGRYLIVGSHNWTESALSRNHEYSTLLEGSSYAEEADGYFQTLWDEGRNP